jgi:hypothetical protein
MHDYSGTYFAGKEKKGKHTQPHARIAKEKRQTIHHHHQQQQKQQQQQQ